MGKENKNQYTVKILNNISLPSYMTLGASGFDIRSNHDILINPGETAIVNTGLFLSMPDDIELQVRSRSGLATKGIHVLNSPGTVDSDYRGEVKVILHNSSKVSFNISQGDRIAQGVFTPIIKPTFIHVDNFDEDVTDRGVSGFGSTGIK